MDGNVARAREAVTAFLKTGAPRDEYFLIEFASEPQMTAGFTEDIATLQSRLALRTARGATAMYDALYLAIEKLKRQPTRGKHFSSSRTEKTTTAGIAHPTSKNFSRNRTYKSMRSEPAALNLRKDSVAEPPLRSFLRSRAGWLSFHGRQVAWTKSAKKSGRC